MICFDFVIEEINYNLNCLPLRLLRPLGRTEQR